MQPGDLILESHQSSQSMHVIVRSYALLLLFIENVIFDQAKSFMIWYCPNNLLNFLVVTTELSSNTSLQYITHIVTRINW